MVDPPMSWRSKCRPKVVRARGGSDSIAVFFHWFSSAATRVHVLEGTGHTFPVAQMEGHIGCCWNPKRGARGKSTVRLRHTHITWTIFRTDFVQNPPENLFYFICFLRRRRKPVFICIKTLDTQMAGLISALDSLFRFAFFPKFGYALSCPTVRGESVRDKKKEERIVWGEKKKQKVSPKTPKDNTTAATATVADGNKSSNINNR